MKKLNEVNFVKFAKAWDKADSVKPLSEEFDISQADCSRLAAAMRKKGIQLKKFRIPQKLDIDVEAINKALGVK